MSAAEAARGAKRRSGIPTRATTSRSATTPEDQPARLDDQEKDSGLSSSECTTPTNGSPPPGRLGPPSPAPPQQQRGEKSEKAVTHIPRLKMIDIIAASKERLKEAERINSNNRTRLLNSRSSSESPRSLDSRRTQVFSPLRAARNVQSPGLDSGDDSSLRLERSTCSYMFQDIVSIKTMLLKLKRVLQESGENGLTRSETLNPFDNSLKNGLFYNLNDGTSTTEAGSACPSEAIADELTDLRRQVVFLQGQLDDKDRTINTLQAQLAKQRIGLVDVPATGNGRDSPRETSNAATQTDKLRPVSTGPSILQGLSQDSGTGPFVSWNDSWTAELQSCPSPARQAQRELSSSSCSSISSKLTCSSPTSSGSRRSSTESSPRLQRPSSLRGLKLPSGHAPADPSPEVRATARTSGIPRRSLTATTMIPRARALSIGRAAPHNA